MRGPVAGCGARREDRRQPRRPDVRLRSGPAQDGQDLRLADRAHGLHDRRANGKVYGINGSAIGEIDPATWSAQKIAQEGGQFLAADGDSHLYFARGAQLYRLK